MSSANNSELCCDLPSSGKFLLRFTESLSKYLTENQFNKPNFVVITNIDKWP